ncbi:MAG: tetratricopeptide repeat protein, partial [Anaerolineae bacterium]|nr:tetratricopeptide repeat protein [Anaerolineae bacterium]
VLQRIYPDMMRAARQVIDPDNGPPATSDGVAPWRPVLAWSCAALLTLVLPVVLYAGGLRQVAADTRFYAAGLERWGGYDALVQLAAERAPNLVRNQDQLLRNAVRQLDEQGRREVAQILLPRPWTLAVVEQSITATLDWLQADDVQRVPAVTISVDDVIRHTREALSVALDRYIAAMPVCPSGIVSPSCRSEEMSVVAYTAAHKPEWLALLDDMFTLVPAEVDLSTAVALSPGTFRKPLATLGEIREARQAYDRLLGRAGGVCLLLVLGSFGVVRGRFALAQAGMILFVIAGRVWAFGFTWSTLPHAVVQQAGDTLSQPPWSDLLQQVLVDWVAATNRLVAPGMIGLLVIGLSLVAIGGFLGASLEKRLCRQPVRVLIVVLVVVFLFGCLYLDAGRTLYERAYAAHRQGDIVQAAAGYRWIARLYPAVVATSTAGSVGGSVADFDGDFIVDARISLAECQAYQLAEAAYEAGDVASSVYLYEAFLARNPAIALQDRARARLVESRTAWAAALWQDGEYERAIDRYHAIQDRTVLQTLADAYLAWGDALRREGDYRAAIATYHRLTFDVVNARLWAEADERIQLAYCEWIKVLRAAGGTEQAGIVCTEFLDVFSTEIVEFCPACAPD